MIDSLLRSSLTGSAVRFRTVAIDDEVELSGGNTHASVVRVGNTVRRPTGPWSPGVHALLRHLETEGFAGAPRLLGIDDKGRETLTYIDGTVVWPDHFDLVRSDAALGGVARCIRQFHDAVATWDLDSYGEWSDMGADPAGPYEVMCHNDLAVWNLVRTEPGWAFIDWDLAAPGRRSWDLAWALHTLVPLWPHSGLDDEEVAQRIVQFCTAYGMPGTAAELLDVAHERCRHETQLIRLRGATGEKPYAHLLADGHDTAWAAAADHIESKRSTWKHLIDRS